MNETDAEPATMILPSDCSVSQFAPAQGRGEGGVGEQIVIRGGLAAVAERGVEGTGRQKLSRFKRFNRVGEDSPGTFVVAVVSEHRETSAGKGTRPRTLTLLSS